MKIYPQNIFPFLLLLQMTGPRMFMHKKTQKIATQAAANPTKANLKRLQWKTHFNIKRIQANSLSWTQTIDCEEILKKVANN